MISKNSKIFLTLGALYLIFWDLAAIFTLSEISSQTLLITVLTNFIPCKLLTGVTLLLNINENSATKVFARVTSALSVFFALIHTFTLGFQFVLIFKGEGATGIEEYFNIANFVGGILIIIAIFFLMKNICGKGFTKTTLSISLIAIIIFIACHIADVVFAISSMTTAGVSGFGAFLSECLTFGFVVWVIGLLAYLIVFTIPTGVFDDKK